MFDRTGTPAADAPDPLQRRAQRLLPAFLGFVPRWLLAWGVALPAAIVAAYLFRPLAWRAALAVARRIG